MTGFDRAMTARQHRFVELFTHGPEGTRGNATRAAAAAGYSYPNKSGSRLLSMPAVAFKVASRQAIAASIKPVERGVGAACRYYLIDHRGKRKRSHLHPAIARLIYDEDFRFGRLRPGRPKVVVPAKAESTK